MEFLDDLILRMWKKIFRAKLNEKFYPIKLSDIFNL